MNCQQLKILAIVLLIGAGVFTFAAIERYEANASNVAAMHSLMRAVPFSGSLSGAFGAVPIQPAVPAATKYCALGAVICLVGGLVALSQSKRLRDAASAASPHNHT